MYMSPYDYINYVMFSIGHAAPHRNLYDCLGVCYFLVLDVIILFLYLHCY